MVQLYCGTTSLITAIFPMRNESEMPSTLLDFICKLGAPYGLFSDNAKVQIGKQYKLYFACIALKTCKVNLITNIRILLKGEFKTSRKLATISWKAQVHHQSSGYYHSFIQSIY